MTYTPSVRRANAPIIADLLVMRQTFAAISGVTPDDVVLFESGVPFAFRLFDVRIYISTGIALATLQLRDAMSGGGNALSDVLGASLVGIVTNSLRPATVTVNAGTSLILRRSNRSVAGEVTLYIAPV